MQILQLKKDFSSDIGSQTLNLFDRSFDHGSPNSVSRFYHLGCQFGDGIGY